MNMSPFEEADRTWADDRIGPVAGALHAAMSAFLKRGDPREAGGLLLEGMMRLTSSEFGLLGAVENRQTLRIVAWRRTTGTGIAEDGLPALPRIQESGILRRAMEGGEVVRSDAPQHEFPADPLVGSLPSLRNFMLVPLHDADGALGGACIANRPGTFGSEDRDNLLLLAHAFGVMLKGGLALDRHAVREARLRQARKMEAVGRLAGGIAHEFNNLLTTILGHSEGLLRRLKGKPVLSRNAGEIHKAGQRAAALTRQLLAFSRRQTVEPILLDLNEILRGMQRTLRSLIGTEVDLQTLLDPGLGTIRADQAHMEQVLRILALNSREAMPKGGRLTMETSNAELGSDFVQEHPSAVAGPYVMLRVADTGVGMSGDVLDHVFEPFFTTKERGRNPGLGLATAYGIIRQSGGYVVVESEPGSGTTFRIYLPRLVEKPSPLKGRVTALRRKGTERVLLAEDDPMVRRLVRETLRFNGYSVLEAANAEEALLLIEKEDPAFDVLVTDLMMPGMGGLELARRLRSRRPELPVLYMSGYSEEMALGREKLESHSAFLGKPFSTHELLGVLGNVLSAPSRARPLDPNGAPEGKS